MSYLKDSVFFIQFLRDSSLGLTTTEIKSVYSFLNILDESQYFEGFQLIFKKNKEKEKELLFFLYHHDLIKIEVNSVCPSCRNFIFSKWLSFDDYKLLPTLIEPTFLNVCSNCEADVSSNVLLPYYLLQIKYRYQINQAIHKIKL